MVVIYYLFLLAPVVWCSYRYKHDFYDFGEQFSSFQFGAIGVYAVYLAVIFFCGMTQSIETLQDYGYRGGAGFFTAIMPGLIAAMLVFPYQVAEIWLGIGEKSIGVIRYAGFLLLAILLLRHYIVLI